MTDEVTVALSRKDAGALVVSLRETARQRRRFAHAGNELAELITRSCDRLEAIADRVEKELNDGQ